MIVHAGIKATLALLHKGMSRHRNNRKLPQARISSQQPGCREPIMEADELLLTFACKSLKLELTKAHTFQFGSL
jgi:hypothetical protein